MLPKPDQFASYVSKLAGIQNHHHVIIYDNSERFGVFSAPRCWYTFRAMGHEFVHIVDGGLPKWIKDGYETASGEYSKDEDQSGDGPRSILLLGNICLHEYLYTFSIN